MNYYLAKSNPQETIAQHTSELLRHYKILQDQHPTILASVEWKLLYQACIYHDLGKMNSKFQIKIYRKIGIAILLVDPFSDEEKDIPHGYLSAAFLDIKALKKSFGELASVLVCAVYYHHFRYPLKNTEYYNETIEKDLNLQIQYYDFIHCERPQKLKKPSAKYLNRKNMCESVYHSYVRVKGLLNRLDYASSGHLPFVDEKSVDQEGKTLYDRVMDYIKHLPVSSSFLQNKCDAVELLRPVQKYMLENRDKNLIITASTGMGKTEGALLWLGEDKGFYTLPLKVSINAIYRRVKEQEKINFQPTSLLHSEALEWYLDNDDDWFESFSKARLFASPLTICTIDQLFKFVFRYDGYESILATLMYSRVIIDEIQMYSPDVVAYIIYGLKMITEYGGKFSIVTATIPRILLNCMNEYKIPYVCAEKPFLTEKLRHRIKVMDGDIMSAITQIEKKASNKKVLVLVNTVKQAQQVYDTLQAKNKYLLHSGFIKKHRQALEDNIMGFSEDTKAVGVWISTQIVEASLDIDFDILFTEMCAIDSLFQRMGRVYRHRSLGKGDPNVYIYTKLPRGVLGTVIDADIFRFSCGVITEFDGKDITEENKNIMMDMVYDQNINPALSNSNYYKILLNRLEYIEMLLPYEEDSETMKRNFRNIDSIQVIPEVIYDKLIKDRLTNAWEKGLLDKNQGMRIKREIQQYTVSISYYRDLPIDFESTLFYKNSGIYLCRCPYEFDELQEKGLGLIRKNRKKYYETDSYNII